MSEDVSATMRVGITVILVAALVATVLNLMVMSNSLLSGGQTTLQSGIDSVSTQEFASYDNTKVSGIVCKTYIDTTTHIPGFFGLLYELGGTISSSRYKSPVYLANIVFAQRLYKYVIKNNIDTLIVPHLFPAETITYIKRNFPNFDNVKSYADRKSVV